MACSYYYYKVLSCIWLVTLLARSRGSECGYPGSPAFGRPHPVRESYRPGEVVSFTCSPGYSLQGPPQRTCQENGTWAGPLPVCDRSLSSLEHQASSRETLLSYPAAMVIDGDFSTCTYTDKVKPRWIRVDLRSNRKVRAVAITVPKGHYARDSAELRVFVISVQGSTTASYHKCASFNGIFTTETLKLPCSGGEVQGRYIHVDDNRNRVDYFSLCEIQVFVNRERYECGEAERPVSSYAVRLESGALEYRCVHGYRLEGPARRLCLPDGQWSEHQPSCTEIVCPLLEEVPQGRVRYVGPKRGRPTQGTAANVSCDYGFRTEGAPLTCQETGLWSEGQLSCQPVDCGSPALKHLSERYVLLNGSTTFGSVAMLRCQDSREAARMCREDATWSPTELDCATQGMLATLGLVEEEQSDLPTGIVVAMAAIVFVLLLLVIFVLLIKRRKKIVRGRSADSLPSKETASTAAPQLYENDTFYASISVEGPSKEPVESPKRNYILFTRKKDSPAKDSSDASSCIYEEIGRSLSRSKEKEPDDKAVYAQVDLDEKRRARLLRSLCQRFEPGTEECSYRSEEAPSFDEVDLEPIKLRELPPLPPPEDCEPDFMQRNDIYEEGPPIVMKDNELYLAP